MIGMSSGLRVTTGIAVLLYGCAALAFLFMLRKPRDERGRDENANNYVKE
jgi:hypothetical protein